MDDVALRVLLIEDNAADALVIKHTLKASGHGGFELERATRLAEGLDRLALGGIDVVLLDLGLPDSWGLETLGRVRSQSPEVPTIVLTGAEDEELAVRAARQGAQDYLVKGRVDGSAMACGLRYAVERKRIADALRRSEESARVVLENVSDVVIALDAEGRATWASPNVRRLLGIEAGTMAGQALADRVYELDWEDWRTLTESPQAKAMVDVRLRSDRGELRRFEAMASALPDDSQLGRVVVTLRDVTERRKLEQQLARSQRIDSVGRLAGGVAHDFNNLLTAVLSYCQLAARSTAQPERVAEYIAGIEQAGQRAAALTRQLLAFSRSQPMNLEVVDLNEVIEGLKDLIRRTLLENIELRTIVEPGLAHVRVDRAQIEQVLLNLAINARDAMPDGGNLTIETANASLDHDPRRPRPGVVPGEYAVIAVTDTGVGMTDEVKEHLFEPFFTTKEFGRGTGLGLAICHGIVQQSGGHISVYSEVGHGTCIKVFLPQARRTGKSAPPPSLEGAIRGGVETILVVEDDLGVRKAVESVLVGLGYTVTCADGPLDALERASRDLKIDLLLTDVVMQGMTGMELAQRMAAQRPGLRVLYMSGYTGASFAPTGALPTADLISKPFTAESLCRRVRERLDRA